MGIVQVQDQSERPAEDGSEPVLATAWLCASCHDAIRSDPVARDGQYFCCTGCADGRHCGR
jgi:hypothetical protein